MIGSPPNTLSRPPFERGDTALAVVLNGERLPGALDHAGKTAARGPCAREGDHSIMSRTSGGRAWITE